VNGYAHIHQTLLPVKQQHNRSVATNGAAHIVDRQVTLIAQRPQEREKGIVALKTGAAAALLDRIGPKFFGPAWSITHLWRALALDNAKD
jgi:hypothetical protein